MPLEAIVVTNAVALACIADFFFWRRVSPLQRCPGSCFSLRLFIQGRVRARVCFCPKYSAKRDGGAGVCSRKTYHSGRNLC